MIASPCLTWHTDGSCRSRRWAPDDTSGVENPLMTNQQTRSCIRTAGGFGLWMQCYTVKSHHKSCNYVYTCFSAHFLGVSTEISCSLLPRMLVVSIMTLFANFSYWSIDFISNMTCNQIAKPTFTSEWVHTETYSMSSCTLSKEFSKEYSFFFFFQECSLFLL